ncbi:ferritin-like domain-containing protein [Bradyrhizobium sp. AZCC 2289]|uniref:ferritin-like domain-containing protein n=1 Tax=Bradyrhizobium sp. AZCC 2289 TaxID=3117026 RepID=UPI002FF0D049
MPNSTHSNNQPLDREAAKNSGPLHNFQRPDMSARDHLVMMLTSGAEIEHALMVQYLYAAYSIDGDQASDEDQAMVEGWRASILSVAREEMGHLLTVQNVLVLLGAPINLGREMLPWDHEFYPFPFSLERLSEKALQCFIYAEMPRLDSLEKPARGKQRAKSVQSSIPPERHKNIIKEITGALAARFPENHVKKDMHRVGELYDEIIELISDPEKIPDSAFDDTTFDMQASWDDWARGYKPSPRLVDAEGNLDPEHDPGSRAPPQTLAHRHAHVQVERVATRAQAVKALRALAAQGEAPHLREDETGEPSHFERFVQIYEEFKAFSARRRFATHAVPRNPTTRIDFHKLNPKRTTYIGTDHNDELAAHLFAQLFNQRYRLLLTYLAHSFRLARTQPNHQPGLRAMVMHRVFGEMYNLKAVADLLVRLPRHRGGRAGPPFEMPYSLDLPQADRDIWRLYDDLLASSQKTCTDVISIAKKRGFAAMREQIVRTGGEAYLHTLMSLDEQTRLWIGKILAGAA